MEIIIKNKELQAKINSFGAELISLIDLKSNKEYMWQKDPRFWQKASPVLFPFIGVLKDNKYYYDGKEYNFNFKHGFARDYDFQVVYKKEDEVEFLFQGNEMTRKIYPFNFKLYLKYLLKGKTLEIEYRVENLEDRKMYFSLGAHPGFSIPLDGGDFSDYYIEFEKEESGELLTLNGILIDSKKIVKGFDGKKITLSKDRFINDAMIIESPHSKKIYLKNDKTGYNLTFDFDGFNYMAFWNVPGAEFICFEPWNGITDYDNASGNIEEKKGIECLDENKTYTRRVKIEIL